MNLTGIEFLIYGCFLLLLLIINAMLVACEISMVKVRYSLIDDDELERLRHNPRVATLLDKGSQVAQVLRFGVLMTTVGLGLLLFPLIFYIVGKIDWFSLQPGKTVLVFCTFVMAVSIISVFGFLVPRGVSLAHPQDTLRFTSWFVLGFTKVASIWAKLLRWFAGLVLRTFNYNVRNDFNVLDYEVQIRALGEEDVSLSPRIRNILSNTLRVRDLEVSDVLLPRNQVKYMDVEDSVEDNLKLARQSGHTRLPLCEGDLDHCIGLIHIKDIFRTRGPVDLLKLRRDILRFDESRPLEEALETLLLKNVHMAIVTDDFGGTLGMITLEAILEVLVGDIKDEFDSAEMSMVHSLGEEDFRMDGLTPLHDLEEALQINVGETAASTLGGWITDELGRMPDAGETVQIEEPRLEITIQEVDEKRILSATVKVMPDVDEDDGKRD